MSFDDYARWLSRVTLAVAIIMIGWGLSVVLGQPVTAWFAASATIWMALLLISAFWQLRGSFTAIAALALATAVVSRLFSILRLNPPASIEGLNPQDLDLLVATGPGVPGFELLGWFLGALVFAQFLLRAAPVATSADSREESLNALALTFIRVYVGLMFVPHFGSHILGGPFQFKIYTLYFASLGMPLPAMQVALAGSIELICAIGLTLGLFTRPVALLGSVYLLMSMFLGGHFQIGYVWALPGRGIRIRRVLGRNDRGIRRAGRRPVFRRQGTMAERAGPSPLTQCRMGRSWRASEAAIRRSRQALYQAFNSPVPILEHAPGRFIDLVAPRPLLMILAKDDAIAPPDSIREAFNRAGDPKRLLEVEGDHYAVYSGNGAKKAGQAATEWFTEHPLARKPAVTSPTLAFGATRLTPTHSHPGPATTKN
jgi:putative oxidoreductase